MEHSAKKVKVEIQPPEIPKDQMPSTFGLQKSGGPIALLSEDNEDSDESAADSEDMCCVCLGWQPVEIRGCNTVVFVTWGKCDFCTHWTHLKYCSQVRVLRRDSVFRCPHCLDVE